MPSKTPPNMPTSMPPNANITPRKPWMAPRALALVACACIGLLTGAAAQAESYQLDMVIFATGGGDGEQSRPAFVPDPVRAIGEQDLAQLRNLGLRVLPEGSSGLDDLWQRVVSGKRYTPLAKISLVQSNPPENRGPVLRVSSGTPIETPAGSFRPLDGTVSLHAGHYLHVDADLVWTQKTNDGNAVSWRLTESRRLKPNELNYLDSARIGALVRVNKIAG